MKLRWYQYSLRTLMLLVLLVAIFMSWFTVKMKQARDRQKVREELVSLGFSMTFACYRDSSGLLNACSSVSGPEWLINILGVDFFNEVNAVSIDQALMYVREVTSSEDLNKLPDCSLAYIESLKNIQILSLSFCNISDQELVHIEGLKNLKTIDLGRTNITDDGLAHLEGLPQIELLDLAYTQVTNNGLVHLEGLKQLKTIVLIGTKVTDEGIYHLKELKQLRQLYVSKNQFSDAGVNELKKTLPNININVIEEESQ